MNQLATTLSINPNLPGITNISTAGPAGWIASFYTFALILSGILAFGAVVYGGFLYATSAGNAHRQEQGTSFIWSALLGLLLLGGAYLILKTINPALIKLQNPTLSAVNVQATTGSGIDTSTSTLTGVANSSNDSTKQTCGSNGGIYGTCPPNLTCKIIATPGIINTSPMHSCQ